MNKVIAQQFSDAIARAQTAKALDSVAAKLQGTLFRYTGHDLPPPLAAVGLTIEGDGTPHGLMVKAHGTSLHGRFDHVWFEDSRKTRTLGGRIRFYRPNRPDGTEGIWPTRCCLTTSAICDSAATLRSGTR